MLCFQIFLYFCTVKTCTTNLENDNIMQKLTIEYPLATDSPKIIWDMISNAAGMQKWLADEGTEEDNETMTFTWGQPWTERDTKKSRILNIEKVGHIRLMWD